MTDSTIYPEKRNREATQRRIIDAAKAILKNDGFQGFGINAVARAAECDKQLIYKYFGGLDGVVNAIGKDLGDWIRAAVPLPEPGDKLDYAQRVERMLIIFLRALRRDRLAQRIMAWEVSEDSPLARRFSQTLSSAVRSWSARLAEIGTPPPPGIDHAAVDALLIAAVQHAVLASGMSGRLAGLQLSLDADWARLEMALRHIVRATLGQPRPRGQSGWDSGISIVSPS